MKNSYESPLCSRYASDQMQYIFSPDKKFKTWRRLWVALAQAEQSLGLGITDAQINEMRAHIDDIDYDAAARYERECRHDVMAHIKAFGDKCPASRGIIHLGATSCFVGDNTDIIIMREALWLLRGKILTAIKLLADFAEKYKALPTLGFTHFQPAQPTTVGKRASLWIQDLVFDLQELDFVLGSMKLLGSKGTTGTQASFKELFDGDMDKIRRLDKLIADEFGFDGCYAVSGQTYSRKLDSRVLNALSAIAQSAHKFSNDIRLLAHLKEIEEPFEPGQIGSSAMAYKRNPMRSERIASLSRYVICNALNPAITAASQWFERTLDDSANKRVSVPEAFLAVDAILNLVINVSDGLIVHERVINAHLSAELPFMATENILMSAVKAGGDRQALHERIRVHSMAAAAQVKDYGGACDLLERIANDKAFGLSRDRLNSLMNPEDYVGLAPEQVDAFLSGIVAPLLAAEADQINGELPQINV